MRSTHLRSVQKAENENVTITSEANDHSRDALMSCWRHVLSYIRENISLRIRRFFIFGVMVPVEICFLFAFSV